MKKESIKSNLFPAAQQAVEPWDEFLWHSGVDKIHSSQALTIDVFGTFKMSSDRDNILDHIATEIGLPVDGPWKIHLEWKDSKNLLEEKTQTQVDAVASNNKSLIFFECKFTESGGACSQTDPIKEDHNKGKIRCSGNYKEQTSPVNDKIAQCSLSGRGIRYWKIIPEIFDYDANLNYDPCPFAGSWYQWMRNLTVCWEVAKHRKLIPAFVLVFADAPGFPIAEEIRTEEWSIFVKHLQLGKMLLRTLSFQELVSLACESAISDLETFQELLKWVGCKIALVAQRAHMSACEPTGL